MLELKAIALAGMFEPPERVISTFMEAQDVDRTKLERAISNLKVYEAMLTKNSTMPTQGPWLIKIDAIRLQENFQGLEPFAKYTTPSAGRRDRSGAGIFPGGCGLILPQTLNKGSDQDGSRIRGTSHSRR